MADHRRASDAEAAPAKESEPAAPVAAQSPVPPAPAPAAPPPAAPAPPAQAAVEHKPQAKAEPKAAEKAAPHADQKTAAAKPEAQKAAPQTPAALDVERLAQNVTRAVDQAARIFAAMRPAESVAHPTPFADEMGDAVRSLGKAAEYWVADPARMMQAHTALSSAFVNIWGNTFRRMTGEDVEPAIAHDPRDKRFADPMWRENPLYDFFRQTHAMTTAWADHLVMQNKDLDELARAKANFYVRQISAALSPSNFIPTNPELTRKTLEEEGENLVRGMQMLAEDIDAGKGSLKLRQSDSSKFKLGENMATTPGKVVWRNDLIELLQYEPTTETVYKRPLLICPPWINKFYILDLNAEKSFIRWCVDQGLTVFVISWVNPDGRLADKGFDDYMREGILESLDVIERITGEHEVTSIGYCVGGTLMSVALAYLAATGDQRITSSTLFTTQVDFTDPGELKVFTDADTIRSVESKMASAGFLDGSRMANAFNMLRPSDLIWSYVVNNYMKGQAPMAFDLLTWNSDSTRMTRANHSFYLRECYLTNNLAKGNMVIDGQRLDLGKITVPIYDLAAKEDHIAPAKSAFNGAKLFGGEVEYVMAGSGHIAGVVNPPYKPKYQFWTGERPSGAFEDWVKAAKETPGSWWPHWIEWIKNQAPDKVPAREPGGGKVEILGDAPGEYVRAKC
ncbi:MAG: class I poly(R)-hydroxyalkanoic acid synthase [Hyphomicrobiales bacterium]|nr:class I poly(R)-hydroxyalkanoic acid synthase [Hyphomicrobiales bacterium]